MNLKETYDLIAEDWHKDHSNDTWWVEGTDKFVSLLTPGAMVLDVGCGAGTKSKWLINKGVRVIGVDFSENMIKIAKREVPSGEFYIMDIKNLQELKENFDGVLAQAVLLHLPKTGIVNTIKELGSKLKASGYLYLAVKEQRPNGPEEEILTKSNYGYDYQCFFTYFTLPEIKKYLTEAGMKVCYENVTSSGKTIWIQVIAQKLK